MAQDILVIDDNAVIIKIVSEILRKQGYEVRSAQDGLSALNMLEEYTPDIIFVDLVLPKISGDMLCKVLRSKKRFADTYIVILSAIAAERGPDLGKLGADTCIAKGKNMAKYLLSVVDDIEQGVLRDKRFTIHGKEDVYAREVTVELLDSKKHLEVILANLSDGLLEITDKGEVVFANRAAEEILAAPLDQILGTTFWDFFSGTDHTYVQEIFAAAQNRKEAALDDQPLAVDSRFINLRIVPLAETGSASCIVIMHDMTERKITEEALQKSEEHYRELIENTSDMVQNIGPDGTILYVNPAWEKALGYSELEMSGLTISDIIAPAHRQQCRDLLAAVCKGERVENIETAFLTKDGSQVAVLGNVSCRMENGQPVYARGIFHDITVRKQLEDKLQKSLADFESIFENSLVGIFQLDAEGIMVRCNDRLAEMAGYKREELIGTDCRFLHLSEDHFNELQDLVPLILKGHEIQHIEFPFRRKDGSRTWSLLSGKAIDINDPRRGMVGIADDISERKQLEEKLTKLSTTDQLTGAYNRRGFDDFFSRETSRSKRYGEALSLALFDIDHFKKVNDNHGHDVGDKVLQELVRLSKEQVREIDSLFRWGGEEFLLLMPKTPLAKAELVVERLRSKVAGWDFLLSDPITISIGVSAYQVGESAERLIKRADQALYQAKKRGRNRVEVNS